MYIYRGAPDSQAIRNPNRGRAIAAPPGAFPGLHKTAANPISHQHCWFLIRGPLA